MPTEAHSAANQPNTLNPHPQLGAPFPFGPIIPRPDATWAPLWKEVGFPKEIYTFISDNIATRFDHTTKSTLTSSMDLGFCNFYKRSNPNPGPVTKEHMLSIYNYVYSKLPQLYHGHLSPYCSNLTNLYTSGRNNARQKSLLFAPPYYPSTTQPQNLPNVSGLEQSYDGKVKKHLKKLLLSPHGEWAVLTLLFNKLIHTHMAWYPPNQIRQDRSELYYQPLIKHLERCVKGLDHLPMIPDEVALRPQIAAGILMNIRRIAVLFFKSNPKDPLDPFDENLPDCLRMGSWMWVNECVIEVKQIFAWIQEQDKDEEDEDKTTDWQQFLNYVDGVATLATEIASIYTAPYTMKESGIITDDPNKNAKRLESYEHHSREFRRKIESFIGINPFQNFFDEIHKWGVRSGQLNSFYKTSFQLMSPPLNN